jgi:uncharacterized protein YycO
VIALYKGRSALSRIIEFRTWSPYSHAAWVDEDLGQVIETWEGGVGVSKTLGERHAKGTRVDLFSVTGETREARVAIRTWLMNQVGKPYDYWALLGFLARSKSMESQAKWFCSELVFQAYASCGIELLARVPAAKVDPGLPSYSPLLIYTASDVT